MYGDVHIISKELIQVNPKHANTLYNYAVMLDTHLKKKEDAETLYRRCLATEPRHAFALYNLAVLLEERLYSSSPANSTAPGTRQEEVAALYRKAVEADPRDASTLADYGRFLLVRMDDEAKGRQMLATALKMNPSCEVALYNLAVLHHRQKPQPDLAVAADMLRALLAVAPQHANAHLQLARVLGDAYRRDCSVAVAGGVDTDSSSRLERNFTELCRHYEKAVSLLREPGEAILEYLKLAAAFGSAFQKRKIVELCSLAINHATAAADLSSSSPAAIADFKAIQAAKPWIEKINRTLAERTDY